MPVCSQAEHQRHVGADEPRARLRRAARGYQPTFDKLPWKDKYDAKKSSEKL